MIVFRLLWGFVGSHHARFASFLAGPSATLRSIGALASTEPSNAVGHTAIGGWSAVLMITLVLIQAVTGLFISDDIFYAGPYNGIISSSTAGTLASIHHLNFTVLQVVVGIHLCAIAWYRLRKRTNLVLPMITGRKHLPQAQDDQVRVNASGWLAIVLILLVAGAVTALVQLAPPPPVPDYF